MNCQDKEDQFNKVLNTFKKYFSKHDLSGELREEPITWSADHSSAFFLMAEKTSVEGQEELLVFDFEDLINGIGGALGLFLGWSLLYLGRIKIYHTASDNYCFYLFLVTESYKILPSFYHYITTNKNKSNIV